MDNKTLDIVGGVAMIVAMALKLYGPMGIAERVVGAL